MREYELIKLKAANDKKFSFASRYREGLQKKKFLFFNWSFKAPPRMWVKCRKGIFHDGKNVQSVKKWENC